MQPFDSLELKKLYIPSANSHKGQNGKLLLVGGSHLFHAASLWALEIASKIVDMVFYASVPENNQIIQDAKEGFKNGIVIKRSALDAYANEADCILIGPGMVRADHAFDTTKKLLLEDINMLKDEGEQTYYLTKYLLHTYPHKKWVIDAGALQMMEKQWLRLLRGRVIITPHHKEFERVFGKQATESTIKKVSQEYNCIILVKGEMDMVCSPYQCLSIFGGNAGMTKGGTGDVLAGLTGALACNNDLFLAATCASYLNKKAGDNLYEKIGFYFNATDLVNEIPLVMKQSLL